MLIYQPRLSAINFAALILCAIRSTPAIGAMVLILLGVVPCSLAAEPGQDATIEQAIDFYVNRKLAEVSVVAMGRADDATLVRRITLDLAGRIPTLYEAQDFVKSTDSDKRAKLVDRLIGSVEFARHQRNEYDTMLASKSAEGFRDYLLQAFIENRPWDKMFRELMLGREGEPVDKQPSLGFLRTRAQSLDDMTRDTSRLFFGIDVSCAKCHDHPLVQDWKQDHYFGMASFFNRTYMHQKQLGEASTGQVEFSTIKGETRTAKLMFLSGAAISEPAEPTDEADATGGDDKQKEDRKKKQREKRKKEEERRKNEPYSPPSFSRRAQLVEVGLNDPNRYFARSAVNRIWARLFGRGIVSPVDQMHSENSPSHPELLDWLTDDFIKHGYDLRRVVRGIVLSEAYARSSRWEGQGAAPKEEFYAVANVRPLTPYQYGAALVIGSRSHERIMALKKPEEIAKRLVELNSTGESNARRFEAPDANFQVSASEALLLSNNPWLHDLLKDDPSTLPGQLKTLTDEKEFVETAFWTTLSRAPEPDEVEAIRNFRNSRADRPEAACQQIVWALLTSSEIRFNH